MLRAYLRFNKNILIAMSVSVVISAIVAQLLADQIDYLNTTYTTVVDYVVFFSVFGLLFYLDNRAEYRTESGTDNTRLRNDLKKLITSLGVGEIIYTIARWVIQYYMLVLNYDPYIASIISQVISGGIYLVTVNLGLKITRMY